MLPQFVTSSVPALVIGPRVRPSATLIALAFVLSAAGSAPSVAASILDQDSTSIPGSPLFSDGDGSLAQVFAVGRRGRLDAIEVTLLNVPTSGTSFTVAVFNPAFDPITNPVLTLGLLGEASFNGFTTPPGTTLIDLSAQAISVQPGDVLVFDFAVGDPAEYLSVAGASGYSGGNAFFTCFLDGCNDPLLGPGSFIDPGTDWTAVIEPGVGPRSVAFRSFIAPEPSLIYLGVLGILGLRRRLATSCP